ncbi:adenosylcobinamide kinase /adenosylcobinamide-phosphate guanylyltransferase [Paucidesulfovibrio gracilis DSM 16080]|uniref:Adenosylcobinamide kinase n=1 Tax=Paucidesulfovibrio gracilis DSM 16080 TaxID=1121449 RepID=A0A1T4XFN2_9BACT|nr:bifunctional adenosylcobinamide kinase/adenosylcobinamide-phosphate guanylyltransferase [Paucidesulfovibrio gracilis]SKA88309.1 adenosylcobinamide kinase /adenosylcobinamide-phosphate guanylyltransferase [Paucidesulfovibrio gracilis DSM 16080]
MISLVLGGNKSGKSAFALDLLENSPAPALFMPTGKAMDLAFRQQILKHKRERGVALPVAESGPDLPHALRTFTQGYGSVLVDSLDFWLFSCNPDDSEDWETDPFVELLRDWDGPDLILVSCEIGLGPLPAGREARFFVRRLGALNQAIARIATQVYLVSAGLPLTLKKG